MSVRRVEAAAAAVQAAAPEVIVHEMTALAGMRSFRNPDRLFAATNELPALAFTALVFAILLWWHPWRALLWSLPPALLVGGAAFRGDGFKTGTNAGETRDHVAKIVAGNAH